MVFKPSTTGAHAASLVIASDDPGSPMTVALQGSGVAPKLSVKPRKAKFGTVQAGSKKTKKVTITNTGTAALKVSTIKLKGGKGSYQLRAKSCAGKSVATGATCTFKVVFSPKKKGSLPAKVTIITDGGTATLKLQGVGG